MVKVFHKCINVILTSRVRKPVLEELTFAKLVFAKLDLIDFAIVERFLILSSASLILVVPLVPLGIFSFSVRILLVLSPVDLLVI